MSSHAPESSSALTTPPPFGEATPGSASPPPTPPQMPAEAPVADDEQQTCPDSVAAAPAAIIPQPFGEYELLEELAQGGMGIVYRARHRELGRIVALKTIRSGLVPSAEEMVRFAQEARAAARLDHPHIIPVYDIGQHEGQPYFTMQLARGGNLNQHRERLFADPSAAVGLVVKVARAVQSAHKNGILHRDLKPANILLDERAEPLVADFGLAKLLDASASLTHTGQILGTPAYMAPEQAAARSDEVSARTDVWALGVILYELLAGRRPFPGQGRDEVISQILNTEPPTLRTVRPGLASPLEAIVLKCLEKDPVQRYGSAADLADDLERWLQGERPRVRPRSRARRLARAAGRRPFLLGTLVLLPMMIGLAVFISNQLASDAARRAQELQRMLQQQLVEGTPVTLVEQKGKPILSRLAFSEGETVQSVNPRDGHFEVDAWKGISLLELLPDPGIDRFRLHAEVQHTLATNAGGRVGIYIGHSTYPIDKLTVHGVAVFGFNDVDDRAERSPDGMNNDIRVNLLVCWLDATGRISMHRMHSGLSRPFTPAGWPDGRRPWRKLTIEVRPDEIRAWVDENSLGVSDRSNPAKGLGVATEILSRGSPDPTRVRPRFGPREGVGLYVHKAGAKFRSVVIEPLRERE